MQPVCYSIAQPASQWPASGLTVFVFGVRNMVQQGTHKTAFRSPRCQALCDYWWNLRAETPDGVPTRAMIDPGQIKPLLPYLLIHDLATPGKSVLRLVGTAIAERFGLDPTGRDYMDFVSPERQADAYHHLHATATHPCGMRVINHARYQSGKWTVAEAVGYPLRHHNTGAPMMLFLDDLVEEAQYDMNQRERPVELFHIPEREYLDVGFGVPNPRDRGDDGAPITRNEP